MLAFLGWNPGTSQELFSLDELIEEFTLERVGKSGAKFDPDKTKWFNQQYLRNKSNSDLGKLLKRKIEKDYPAEFLAEVAGLMKERASFVEDMLEGDYLFNPPSEYDAKTLRKKWKETTPANMENLKKVLNEIADFNATEIELRFKAFLEDNDLGMGAVLPNFRLLVTGKGMGPSMFQIAALLGKKETIDRFNHGIEKITQIKAELNPS